MAKKEEGEDSFFIEQDGAKESLSISNIAANISSYKIPTLLAVAGLIAIGLGVLFGEKAVGGNKETIEVLDATTQSEGWSPVVAEIAGAVEKPGVYELDQKARIADLLEKAGGLASDADKVWVNKMINRAALVKDGQKIYIPATNEQSDVVSARNLLGVNDISDPSQEGVGAVTNINTASSSELEALWGIGPVTAQNIIEQRPYSSVDELLTKKILKQNVYDRNKDLLTAY